MDKLCEKLLTTYNASILENTDILGQALFYHYSSKNLRGNKGNTVLMDLITNYYNNKKKENFSSKIGGPISLSLQWSSKYNMCVYIFGEKHSSEIDCNKIKNLQSGCPKNKIRNPITQKCVAKDGITGKEIIKQEKNKLYINVEFFLLGLFQYTPAFIDFYLETPYGYTGQDYVSDRPPFYSGTNRLSQLSTMFYECLNAMKRENNPSCKLVRVHYIDIRNPEQMVDVNDISYLRYIFSRIMYLPDDNDKKVALKSDSRIVAIIEKLITKDINEYEKFWKKQLTQSSILEKEFSRTILDKKLLLDFLEAEILDEAMVYRERFQNYLASFHTDNMNINNIIRGVQETCSINSIVVDMYAISRMFKKFKNVKNQPERPHNIIIYSGDAHSTRYRKFLKYLDFKTINETGGIPYDYAYRNRYNKNSPSYENCADISNFKQPFFSEYPPTK